MKRRPKDHEVEWYVAHEPDEAAAQVDLLEKINAALAEHDLTAGELGEDRVSG